MATFSSVSAQHVLQAIAEHDDRGPEAFLAAHGYTPSPDAVILHEGRQYDARAVMAVAHRYATGLIVRPEEFRSSLDQALLVLRRRGFEVLGPGGRGTTTRASRSSRAGAASASPRGTSRRTAPEPAPKLCPTCQTALPATGVCDWC